jgi:F-type H+-transporting ATPase subunit gamma
MEKLARLKARIESLVELQDLMRAMRAFAASQVKEAQRALDGIRQYATIIEDAIVDGAALLPAGMNVPPAAAAPDTLILICSEHGFVGGLNEQLVTRVVDRLRPGQQLAVVGRRGLELADEHGLDVAWDEPMATHIGGVVKLARRVSARLAGVAGAELVCATYQYGGHYEIEARRIVPLDPSLLQRVGTRAPPLHHLPAEALLVRLADEYLLAELARALMEAFASENGARLRVMEAGDRNVGQRLEQLGSKALTLRQQAITAELLELMTGVEALAGPATET